MQLDTRFLEFRAGHWHYNRRVPSRYADIDERQRIRVSLKTTSIDTAKQRRDAMFEADNLYWAALSGIDGEAGTIQAEQAKRFVAERRYRAAGKKAMARGFLYTPADDLAEAAALHELVERIRLVDTHDMGRKTALEKHEAEALLGGVSPPPVTISEAFDIYCEKIACDELIGKSDAQKKSWIKTKKRGVQYLINLIGDKPLLAITRQDAQQYHGWWRERLVEKRGRKTLRANTANRDLGNVRKLFAEYCKFIGEEDRANPFRNLSFRDKLKGDVPPFEDAWVRSHILKPGALNGLNEQAAHIVYALIETGCRPGEIANLEEEDIILDHDVPHIRIRPKRNREIKSTASIREIPLVGVSLAALKRFPKGFDRYRDKPDLLSATLMKAFKVRKLFPTPAHKIYSFRHSFEKRMLEAGIDRDLRMTLMGHTNARPAYGDGGSLSYRREELLKIVHPLPQGIA
ncbi:MAG: tyrosine-type recombinase/integrase [Novosphingobium sp.]|nr:tyrosine-type recombinase/integrase [Novosphingobium sp.]